MSMDTKRARESAKYIDGLHWRTDQVGYASSLNGTTVAELIRALADEVDELRERVKVAERDYDCRELRKEVDARQKEREEVWKPLVQEATWRHPVSSENHLTGHNCGLCANIAKARAALGEDG